VFQAHDEPTLPFPSPKITFPDTLSHPLATKPHIFSFRFCCRLPQQVSLLCVPGTAFYCHAPLPSFAIVLLFPPVLDVWTFYFPVHQQSHPKRRSVIVGRWSGPVFTASISPPPYIFFSSETDFFSRGSPVYFPAALRAPLSFLADSVQFFLLIGSVTELECYSPFVLKGFMPPTSGPVLDCLVPFDLWIHPIGRHRLPLPQHPQSRRYASVPSVGCCMVSPPISSLRNVEGNSDEIPYLWYSPVSSYCVNPPLSLFSPFEVVFVPAALLLDSGGRFPFYFPGLPMRLPSNFRLLTKFPPLDCLDRHLPLASFSSPVSPSLRPTLIESRDGPYISAPFLVDSHLMISFLFDLGGLIGRG